MQKFLRTLMLAAVMLLPLASQAQADCTGLTIPYAENFDAYTGNSTSTSAPTGYPSITLPDCWSFLNMSTGTSSYPQVFLSNSSSYAVSGNCLFFKSSNSTPLYAIMPDVGAQSGAWQLSFQYRNEGTGATNGTIIVGVMSDPTDATTFVALQTCARTTTKTLVELTIADGTVTSGSRLAFCYQNGSSSNYYAAIDNVSLTEAPSCLKVTNLAINASLTTSSSLTLTWTDALNTGATYSVYDMSDTSLVATGITDTFYTVPSLDANTEYTYAVMTDCGGGDVTELTTPVTGRTACAAAITGTTWNFDEMSTSATPMCFTHLGNGSSNVSTGSSTDYYHSATKYIQFSGAQGNNFLILPETEDAINTLQLKFWTRPESTSASCGSFSVGYITDVTDITTFTALATYSYADFGSTIAYTEKAVMFDAAPAGARMAFCHNSGSTYYYWRLDDVSIEELPGCIPASNLAVVDSMTTPSSITLSWLSDATSFVVYDMADSSIIATCNTNSYTVTGLTGNTAYTFGVAVDCSTEMSDTITVAGRTACEAIATLPWTCGFEADEIVNTTQATALPWCSSRYTSTATSGTSYPYSYSSNAHEGSRSLYYYGTTSSSYPEVMAWIMPEFDVNAYPMNANRVSFWAKMGSASYDKNVYVYTLSDATDWTTATLVDSVLVSGTTHVKYNVSLTTATATNAYLALVVKRGNGSLYIDDVTLEEMPSCLDVLSTAVNGVTENSITLTWVANDQNPAGTTYSVYNMSDTSLVAANIADTFYTVLDLNPSTNYVFGIQANCASGDAPFMTVSARTACGVMSLPFSENFDAWTTKSDCWSFLSGAYNNGAGTPTASTSAWTLNSSYGDYITISGKALTMNLYNTYKYWAVTPAIAITSDAADLSVDVAVAAWSAATPNFDNNDSLIFAVTADSGATYTTIAAYDYNVLNALGNTYTTLTAQALGYNGQTVRFVIYGGSTSGTSPYDNRLVIDNVTVVEGVAPACLPVTGLTADSVTAHGATLTWNGSAAAYNVYAITATDTTLAQSVTDTFAVLTGLSGETAYTYGVAADCGSEESDTLYVSFTTLISCPATTTPVVTLTPGNGALADIAWGSNGEESAWQICLMGTDTTFIDVVDSAYNFTDLTAEATYSLKVRAICGDGDTSAWSSTVTFTPTNAYTITVNDGTNTNGYVPVYGLYVDEGTKSQFIIRAADLTAMTYGYINSLTFYATQANVNWGAATFDVYLTETADTALSAYVDLTSMTQVLSAATLSIVNNKMEVTLTTPYQYMGGNLLVCFNQPVVGTYTTSTWKGVNTTGASMSSYGSNAAYQRNFLPKTTFAYTPGVEPSCLPVTGLTATATATDATLTWEGSATSYNVYDMSDSSLAFTVTDTTVTIVVSPMTTYTYGVAANCGSEESDLRTVTFTTGCAALGLPFTENFESNSATFQCWSTQDVASSTGRTDISGNGVFKFNYNTNPPQYLISPEFTASTNNIQVSFDYWVASDYYEESFALGYSTTTNDITAFTWGTEQTELDNQSALRYSEVLPAGVKYIAIKYTANDQYALYIDSLTVVEMSSDYCFAPTNVTATDITTNSATLTWSGNASSYTVINFENNTSVTVTDTTYALTGLSPMNAYFYGVAANCTSSSSDTVLVTFMTECVAVNLPFTETFELTSATTSCWSMVDCDDETGIQDGLFAFLYNTNPPQYLISPEFVAPTDSVTVSFKYAAYNSNYPESFAVGYSTTTDDITAFTWGTEVTNITNTTFNTYTQVLPAGVKYVSIKYTANDQWALLIDTFQVYTGSVPPVILPDSMKVTVAVNDATMGTTNPAPGVHYFAEGTVPSVVALPNTGYHLAGWTIQATYPGYGIIMDTTVATNEPDVFVLLEIDSVIAGISSLEFNVTANFAAGAVEPDSVTMTFTVNDATMGSINPSGVQRYAVGDILTITATPNTGYHLYGWMLTVDGQSYTATEGITNTYTDTVGTFVDGAIITALFAADDTTGTYYTLTVNYDSTMGTIIGIPEGPVAAGTMVSLTARANDGYHFVAWSTGETTPTIQVTVNSNMTIDATFAVNGQTTYYTLTVNYDTTMGTVVGIPEGPVEAGTVLTLTARAKDGYRFINWSTGETSATIEVVMNSDKTIDANFSTVGIDDVEALSYTVYSVNSKVVVKGVENMPVFFFDVNGRTLRSEARATETVEFTVPSAGVYFVKVGNDPAKRVVVMR